MTKKIFLIFASWRILLYLFMFLATFILPFKNSFVTDLEFRHKFPYLIWVWGNFDGFHYMYIAKTGYHQFQYSFFPLYPLLLNLPRIFLEWPRLITGQIISNLSFILSLFLFYKLLSLDKVKHLFLILSFVIILFPTSLFYAAVYNDAIFLLLALLSIYFARKRFWIFSALFGSLATLTRLNGLALAFLLFFEYLSSKNETPAGTWDFGKNFINNLRIKSILHSKIYALILIPLAFLGYLLYTQISFGDWNLVFSSMAPWGQDRIIFPLQVFWRYLKIIFLFEFSNLIYWVAIWEVLFIILYLFMIVYSFRKIRCSYWFFFAVSILMPSLTGTFQGMPRYGLHIYPLFLSLALFLENRGKFFKFIYFTLSAALLFFAVALFTRGYFIA